MDTATQKWLISQLGSATDLADLADRYTRLGKARAVALEVINQRLADLRAQVAVVGVSGVVNVSFAENIKAYERQIALLEAATVPAPDEPIEPPADTEDDSTFGLIFFTGMERR